MPAIMPLSSHLCRDLAAHAFNTEPLNQRIDTVPRVQSVQLRLGPSRWARTWSRAPCLRLVIVAVIAGFFHGSIVVFYDCDNMTTFRRPAESTNLGDIRLDPEREPGYTCGSLVKDEEAKPKSG